MNTVMQMPINVSIEKGNKDPNLVLHVFLHSLPNVKHILKNGKTIHFQAHHYYTDCKKDIEELKEEIESGNPFIRTADPPTIIAEDLNPMEVMKKKIIAEYEENKRKAESGEKDMGSSVQGTFNPANSTNTVGTAAESNTPTSGRVIKVGPRN